MVRRASAPLALMVTLLGGLGARAQLPPQAPPSTTPPVFRSGISYVELDASVLDRNRNPVRGLDASDFTVLENGQPQKILSFSEIDVPDPEPPPAAWMRDVPPDVQANDKVLDRRLVVILLDDGQIRVDRTQWNHTQDVAKMLIDRLGPADLAAVLFTRIQRDSQDFTSDHAELKAAIDAFVPGAERRDAPPNSFGFEITPAAGNEMQPYFWINTVAQVSAIARYLAALPDRRKALFFLSVGPGRGTGQEVALNPGPDILEMYREALQANVNIYPIDPSGLGGVDDVGVAGSSAPGTGSNIGIDWSQEALRAIGESTGGYAITNRNDFDTAVPRILRENGSYYLLGYESPDLRTNGKFRTITVRVNRPGVTVRARSGYYGAPAVKPATAEAKSSRVPPAIDQAAGALLPSAALRMRLAAAPFAVPGKPAATVLAIGVHPAMPEDLTTGDEVDVFAGAFRVDGTMAASTRQHVRIGAGWLQYDLLTRLDLKPGRYQLRASAESKRGGVAGSVFGDVEVPDFSAPLVLSGVIVHAEPGVSTLPAEVAAPLVPYTPTTVRTFSPRQQVTAFMRIYQGGKAKLAAVSLSARVRDVHDAVVLDAPQTLSADRFGAERAVEYQLTLPVDRLAPGPYLLTIDASAGTRTARRDVRFEVR